MKSIKNSILAYFIFQGLSAQAAAENLEKFGPNSLKEGPSVNWGRRFMFDVFGDFNLLIWVGGILCFMAYGAEYSETSSPSADNVSVPLLAVDDVI